MIRQILSQMHSGLIKRNPLFTGMLCLTPALLVSPLFSAGLSLSLLFLITGVVMAGTAGFLQKISDFLQPPIFAVISAFILVLFTMIFRDEATYMFSSAGIVSAVIPISISALLTAPSQKKKDPDPNDNEQNQKESSVFLYILTNVFLVTGAALAILIITLLRDFFRSGKVFGYQSGFTGFSVGSSVFFSLILAGLIGAVINSLFNRNSQEDTDK